MREDVRRARALLRLIETAIRENDWANVEFWARELESCGSSLAVDSTDRAEHDKRRAGGASV